jgi:hypothetical protein
VSTYNWSQIATTAKENGGGPSHPEGSGFVGEIVKAGVLKKQGKNDQWWWQIKCLVGPSAGKSDRHFQTYAPDNGVSVAIWYRTLQDLGIVLEQFPDGTPPETIIQTSIGRRVSYDIKHDEYNGRTSAKFKGLKLVEGQAPVVVPVAPVAAAPALAPLPAPAPAAAPAAEGPTVEELQAQLAALQQQAAPAPAAAPAAQSALPF